MSARTVVPPDVLAELRAICGGLPDAREEQAWVGVRWRVRSKTFAHVLTIAGGWPAAYAKVAGTEGPATVLTLRSSGEELAALAAAGEPFFMPGWWPDIVGVVLEPRATTSVDWTEITELVTESYCVLAPRKLVAVVRARDLR